MRIAMVGPFGLRPKGTMRARAFRLARALVRRGHAVKLFMPPWQTPEEADRVWQEDGVALRYVALQGGPLAIARRLQAETIAWQPDVVHAFKPKAYSGLVAEWFWRTQRHRMRVVVDADDWEGWGGWNDREAYPWVYKQIFVWQERWGMRHCHALTVASRALETLAWGAGVPPAQVRYLPNGVGIPLPAQPVARTSDRPTVLLYSRFFEFDAARLVAVLQRVRTAVPALRVRVVGASLQAEDGARFAQLMEQAGLTPLVEALGWVAEEQVAEAIGAADLGLYLMDDNLLNRAKCPVKLADMAAVGLPVVGEAVGQVPEYVRHGETGLLRACGAIEGLAADVVRLLEDAPLRQAFGAAAREHMQQFDWDRLAGVALAAYCS